MVSTVADATLLLIVPKPKKPHFSWGDSSNVDKALTRIAQAKTRLFKSGSMYLILQNNLVAGVGFEPTTFRL
jgi:hypothetical protein